MLRLAHSAVLLAPSQYTLDHVTCALRAGVALVPGGSSVNGRLAYRSGLCDIVVDGDGRGDVLRPQVCNVCGNILVYRLTHSFTI